MADKLITSTITDADHHPDEIQRHLSEAAGTLGPDPKLMFRDAEVSLGDDGSITYKITSVWRSTQS